MTDVDVVRSYSFTDKKGPRQNMAEKVDTIHLENVDLEEEDSENFSWNLNVCLNVLALYVTNFATVWGYGIPGSCLAFIEKEYPGNPTLSIWVAVLPPICICATNGWVSELSDIFDRKSFLLIGSAFGFVGMMILARGTSLNMLIGGQVFNGIALSLTYLATALLAEVVPKRQRGPILGATIMLAAASATAGQLAAGAFLEHNVLGLNRGWRVDMYIGAGISACSLILIFFFYTPGKRPNPSHLSTKERLLKIDWIGFALWTAGLLTFLLGLTFGGNPDPWSSPKVLSLLIVGLGIIGVFTIWEWKFVTHGLFDRDLFQHRNFSLTLVLNFVEGMVTTSAAAFFPQITLNIFTTNSLRSIVLNLGFGTSAVASSIFTAGLLYKTKDAKRPTIICTLILTLAAGLFTIIHPGINLAAFVVPSMLVGFVSGCVGVTIPLIASLCTPDRLIATSVGLGQVIRGLGASLGPVIFAQVFSSKLKSSLPTLTATAMVKAGLPVTSVAQFLEDALGANPENLPNVPGFSLKVLAAFEEGLKESYAIGFRYLFISLIPFAAITVLISVFLTSTKEQMSLKVASAVEDRRHKHVPTKAEEA